MAKKKRAVKKKAKKATKAARAKRTTMYAMVASQSGSILIWDDVIGGYVPSAPLAGKYIGATASTDGEMLVYDSTSDEWTLETAVNAGTIQGRGVTTNAPPTDALFYWNGSEWNYVRPKDPLTVNGTDLEIDVSKLAGDGLSDSGTELMVTCGAGLEINADAVELKGAADPSDIANSSLTGVDGTGNNAAPVTDTLTALNALEDKVNEILVALRTAEIIS